MFVLCVCVCVRERERREINGRALSRVLYVRERVLIRVRERGLVIRGVG